MTLTCSTLILDIIRLFKWCHTLLSQLTWRPRWVLKISYCWAEMICLIIITRRLKAWNLYLICHTHSDWHTFKPWRLSCCLFNGFLIYIVCVSFLRFILDSFEIFAQINLTICELEMLASNFTEHRLYIQITDATHITLSDSLLFPLLKVLELYVMLFD